MVKLPPIDVYSKTKELNDDQIQKQFFVERKNKRDFTLDQGMEYITKFIENAQDKHGADLENLKVQIMTPIGMRSILGSKAGIRSFLEGWEEYFNAKVAQRGKFNKIKSIYINMELNN